MYIEVSKQLQIACLNLRAINATTPHLERAKVHAYEKGLGGSYGVPSQPWVMSLHRKGGYLEGREEGLYCWILNVHGLSVLLQWVWVGKTSRVMSSLSCRVASCPVMSSPVLSCRLLSCPCSWGLLMWLGISFSILNFW